MRLDKFVNAVNLTKRRSVAQDMIAHGAITLNGQPAKAAKEVRVGDIIGLHYLSREREAERVERFEVLALPKTKTIPKSAQAEFVKALS
jgi:ribosomal 50S subunit-recycling heat shock protein